MYFDISINWSSLNDPVMLLNNHLTAGLSIFNILHLNWNISHKILSKRTDSLANSNKNEMHFALIFAFSVIFCEIYFPPWFHEFFQIPSLVLASPLKIDQRSADDYDEFLDGMMFVGKRGFNPGCNLKILDF